MDNVANKHVFAANMLLGLVSGGEYLGEVWAEDDKALLFLRSSVWSLHPSQQRQTGMGRWDVSAESKTVFGRHWSLRTHSHCWESGIHYFRRLSFQMFTCETGGLSIWGLRICKASSRGVCFFLNFPSGLLKTTITRRLQASQFSALSL